MPVQVLRPSGVFPLGGRPAMVTTSPPVIRFFLICRVDHVAERASVRWPCRVTFTDSYSLTPLSPLGLLRSLMPLAVGDR
jgi:hypothetical protein